MMRRLGRISNEDGGSGVEGVLTAFARGVDDAMLPEAKRRWKRVQGSGLMAHR